MKKLPQTITIMLILFSLGLSYAQDWPNLQRFQKENTELQPTNPNEHRIVFMGNSITEGWLALHPEYFANKPYVNRGISGQTTPQMLLRFRQDVINLNPAAVVILAGINDIAGNTGPSSIEMITDNIFSMVELAKANNIKVLLCSVLPANYFPWKPEILPAEKVVALNTLLKAYSESHDVTYVDYYTAMVNEAQGLIEAYGYDAVHPKAEGYAVMEPILEAAISAIFSQD